MNNFLLKLSAYSFQKAMLFGVIAFGAYYWLAYDDGSKLDAQIVTSKAELKKQEQVKIETDKAVQKLETVRNEFGQLSDQFKVVSAKLPTDIQMPEILKTVDAAASVSGVYIKSKEPSNPEQKEIVEDKPIRVVVEGTYSEITLFLYKMTTAERVIKIKKLAFAANTDPRKQSNKIAMDVTFSNYRFVGVRPKDAPGSKGNKGNKG